MDPLSITATIVGIATAAASTANAFKDLRRLCSASPGRLHALSNEVSDIELVLRQVTSVAEKRSNDAVLKAQESHIRHLLDQARLKLAELRTIIETLTSVVKTSKVPIFRAHAWRKNQPRLQALQEDIKNVKCNLNIMLELSILWI